MVYVLWGLLNIGLFVFFIVTCFNATKLIREKVGLFASIILVFGLLSFVARSNRANDNEEPNSNQIKTWTFTSEDTSYRNATHLPEIDLEKTLIAKYRPGIKYGKDKQTQMNVPISAYSSTTGFISGTNWKPVSINVNRTIDGDKFEYSVNGVVERNLPGARIYSQPKEYKGIVSIK